MRKNSLEEDQRDPDYNLFAPLFQEDDEGGPQASFSAFEDDAIGLVDLTEDERWDF
jgi:hypothetical protein